MNQSAGMASNSTVSYKQLKEEFVSNLSGGSVAEICSVTAVAPVCLPDLLLNKLEVTQRL